MLLTKKSLPNLEPSVGSSVRDDGPHGQLLERFEEVDGETVTVLRYSRRVLDEEEEREIISKVRRNLSPEDLIWPFPYVPFTLAMLIGFFVTVFLGDLIVNLVMGL